ncbi:uncharacterized protein LOC107045201 [Diachasma alloeum]|uniref:uncharacterized protein LOC107045201 n=1 Tax=Diachasma alloeum TaxID=454923 RepID=UPI00073826D4|nr:uncharacterized protein LOC107045201 [Diachasma alloeum]
MGSQITIIFFLTIIISILLSSTKASLCQQTVEYIDGKLRNSKVEIAKTFMHDPDSVTTVKYRIEWKSLWTQDLDSQALTISLSGEMFVLTESDQVLPIGIDLNRPELLPKTNRLHEVSTLRSGAPMKFLKSIIWRGTTYLLICYDSDFCNIYTSTYTQETPEFHHQQRTRHEIGRPTDANFFIDNNQLYLVIATNLKAYPSSSVIYRWTGTYMDVIARVSLKSVISVVTFSHKNSRVLIFSQSDEQSYMGSQIYKLIIDEASGQGVLEVTQFLPTNRPVAMRLYPNNGCTFLLVVNEVGPSQVFWWDGTEFLPWMQVENLHGNSLLNSVQMGNNTFFFIAQGNFLSLYKATSMQYELLDVRQFPDVIRIIDIGVWTDGNVISVILISDIGSNRYRVEPLQYLVNEMKKGEAHTKIIEDKSDATETCLNRLGEKLQKRMEDVEDSRAMWEHLHSASKNLVIDTLEADVILRSFQGSTVIENIGIISNTSEEIIPPKKLAILMEDLGSEIVKSLNKSQHLLRIDESTKTLVLPSLHITNEASFGDLDAPALQTNLINDEGPNEHFHNERDQLFNETLRGSNLTIHNLEVESLCGIPRNFWLLKNEFKMTPLKPLFGSAGSQIQVDIKNDTVFMNSNIFLPNFYTSVLNSVNLSDFLDNCFRPGKNQVINSDVVFEHLIVDNLSLQKLRGIPAENLLTTTTDQDVEDSVYIDSLDVQHIYVNKINGISPTEAARVSEENIIKGKLIVNNLKITDELIVDEECDLFKKPEHVQVYENVTIIGSVGIRRLQLVNRANIQLGGLKILGSDVDNLIDTCWTKSTNQTITAPRITFENGLTIDELNTEYLNGMRKGEYLYTTVQSIPAEFGGLHFEDFVVNGSVLRDNQTGDFVEITDDTLVFNERIFFEELAASNIFTTEYNGIPIHEIMNDSRNPNDSIHASLPDDFEFHKVVVNDDLRVTDLHFEALNDRDVSTFLFVDQNHKVENVKTTKLRVAEFRSASPSAKVARAAGEFIPPTKMNIIIQGQLIVEENLRIEESINDQNVGDYFDQLSKLDIQVYDPYFVLDEVNVSQDVAIRRLHSIDFDKFVENIFSKTRGQTLVGTKTFHRVIVSNIDASVINDNKIEGMYFVSDPLVFEGNVTFTDLSADVAAETVNTIDTNWIQKDLSYIFSRNITHMTLTGTITWENSKTQRILSDIIEHAVRIDNDEIIETPVDLSAIENVEISSLYSDQSSFSKIQGIIEDALLASNNSAIGFSGIKTFLSDVEVRELVVDILEMDRLETTTVRDLNASIVRKFEDIKMIDGTCTFSDEIRVVHLETPQLGPGMPNISSFFVASEGEDDYCPNGSHFKDLVIKRAVEVLSLDGVNIDLFLKERVTLAGNHVIPSNVRFNGHIHVLGNVEVETGVNGIDLRDIILKDSPEPQIIEGTKTFREDLVVELDVAAPLFNGVNISEAYNNGVLNDESALIRGNIIIEGNIELLQNTTVSGGINGLQLSSVLRTFDDTADQYLRMAEGNITAIDALIANSIRIVTAGHLPHVFYYFELQQQFETSHIGSVNRVIPTVIDNTTRLNVYAVQSGEHCPRLPEGCPCRTQYIIELSENGFVSRKEEDSWVVFNFPETNNLFTISIVTSTISSSSECRSTQKSDEFTAINWMARNNSSVYGNFTHYPEKIPGYLSDAQVFVHGEAAYIVLVMSYDVEKNTREVDSLIYKLDLRRNELNLELKVSTVGATAVEVFKIPERGSHILIAAGQPENPWETAKSLLYRIKPGENEFELLRSFYSGGTRRVESLAHRHQDFVLVDDIQTNAIHIYNYKDSFDNFYLYQSLYFDCRIRDVEVYYSGEFRWGDAYILVTTEDGRFFLYQYMMVGKFEKRMSKWLQGILSVTPFHLPEAQYLLVTTRDNSTVYRCISQGSR